MIRRLRKSFLASCALAVLAPNAGAALFEVTTNAADNSGGSLGAALTSAQGTPASDIVFFGPFISALITPAGPYNVNKTGANSLDLDANQSTTVNFAGGMTVTSGILNVNALTASGITVAGGVLSTSYSTINGLVLNGGTFQTRDNSVTSGITLGGGSIDVDGSRPSMSGLTGAGGLILNDSLGGGVLSLTTAGGANTYVGATQINAGTLQLGAANALPAGGALNTAAAGTFDLNGLTQTLGAVSNLGVVKTGAGTLTAVSYGGAGTLSVLLQAGVTNLHVTGTATLTNGTLRVNGRPLPGIYKVVQADTALTGTFAAINLPSGVTDSVSYTGTSLLLDILNDAPFTVAGQSANQAAVGAALNTASFNATGDLLGVINQLTAMTPGRMNAALDEIGPASYAALSGMSLAGSGVQAAAVSQRLTGLQAGRASPDGARFASFSVSGPQPYPGVLVAELPGDASAAYVGGADRRYDAASPWGFFVSALGTFDRLDSLAGGAGAQPGYSVTATGETLGADYRFNEHFAGGMAVGYVNSFAALASGRGTSYGQSARLGAYGTVYNDSFHGNLYLGGARDFYATSRGIPDLSRNATASPTGDEFNLDATAGWDVRTERAVVSPFVDLAYDRLMLGSFTESGAGDLNLAVSAQTAQSLRSTLGAKVARRFKSGWGDVTPYASAGWQHELENQSRALAASLATGGAGSFTVRTADVSREAALLGAGVDVDWSGSFSTRLSYAADLRTDFAANTFSASLRWRF